MADASYPKVYRKQGNEELVVASGGTLRVESGGTITVESGGTLSIADGALETPDLALAQGSIVVGDSNGKGTALSAKTDKNILVGNGTTLQSVAVSGDVTLANDGTVTIANDAVNNNKLANMTRGTVKVGGENNAPTDLDAKTSGQILVGDGTDIKSVAVSGDATLAATGALTIANGAVTAAKLANGAGLAAAIAAGLGASANYAKTTSGAQTLLAADSSARVVLGIIVVTETFDETEGTQTAFIIGETDATNKFAANTVLVDATAGDIFFFAGTLTATKNLLVTGTPATGDGTGAIAVSVLVLPAAA